MSASPSSIEWPEGFAVVCDERGVVLRVLRGGSESIGAPLFAQCQSSSLNACTLFVRSVAETGFSRSLALRMSGHAVAYAFGIRIGDELWIAGVTEGMRILEFLGSLDPDAAWDALAEHIRRADASYEMYEELSRLNNELVTTQRELAQAVAELRRLNAYKNELLGIAAHDLRSPLNANLAFASFLLEDAENLSEDSQMIVHRLRASTSFMLRLIDDVLGFAAIEAGAVRLRRENVALADIVGEVVDTMRILADRKEIAIDYHAGASPTLPLDRVKLSQAVQNLIANAVKFTPPGKRVGVDISRSDGTVAIAVRDSGPGIPEGERAQLFQPFTQISTEPTAGEKGTGLGLAITKKLVEAHGGTIELETTVEAGSTFTIRLPAQ